MEGQLELRGIYFHIYPLPSAQSQPTRSQPADENADDNGIGSRLWRFYDSRPGRVLVNGTMVVGTVAATVPIGLAALGFTSGGVAAGSIAARLMGPRIVAGSWFSICQSLGATGATRIFLGGLSAPMLGIPRYFRRSSALYTETSANEGRAGRLMANQDIEPGTIVLDDLPIFHSNLTSWSQNEPIRCCLTCGVSIDDPERVCGVCGFPICSERCQNLPIHKANECQYFYAKGIYLNDIQENSLPWLLLIVRVMVIKNRNSIEWTQIQSLIQQLNLDHIRANIPPMEVSRIGENLTNHLIVNEGRDRFNVARKDAAVVQQIFNQVGWKIFLPGPSADASSTRNGQFLFPFGSKFEQSCSPNCIWQIGPAPDFKLRIRATVLIRSGEALTLSLLQNHKVFSRGTIERRRFIVDNLNYFCKCRRCEDRKELESFSSAIKCSTKSWLKLKSTVDLEPAAEAAGGQTDDGCDYGFLLPFYSIPLTFDSLDRPILWKCERCLRSLSLNELYGHITSLADQLDQIHEPVNPQFNLQQAEEFYREVVQTDFLHPNHWLIQEAKFRLVFVVLLRRFLQPPGGNNSAVNAQNVPLPLTLDQTNDYIAMCKQLLEIQDKTNPGFSGFRAQVIHCLSFAIPHRLQFPLADDRSNLELLRLLIELIQEAFLRYHQNFPPDYDGHSDVVTYYRRGMELINESTRPSNS